MKLKTVTLIAAIAQAASVACSIYSFGAFAMRNKYWEARQFIDMGTWIVHLFAGIALIIFLFTLFSRQKTN